MLDGDVEKCMDDLKNSIECGKKWRKIYEKTAFAINKKAALNKELIKDTKDNKDNKENKETKVAKWDFNLNSIFA